jgi:hypothetical protein
MRLHDYAHQADVILAAVPLEHRPTLLAWIAARYHPETGEQRHVSPSVDVSIRCEDCPELGTGTCDECGVLRTIMDDTEVVDD